MELHTTFVERMLHLLLFGVAGVGIGVAGLAVVERLGEGAGRVVRWTHVSIGAAAFALVWLVERLYHALT